MRGWKDKYLLTVTMTMNVYETVGGWPWGKTMTKSPGRRYIISKQQSNIYSFIQHICASSQFNQSKNTTWISLWSLDWVFFYQRFAFCDCILCFRYFLGKIDISLPEPGDPASPFDLLFEFFSFVSCVFYVLDFLGDIGIFPLGPGCPTSSFDLLFEFCVLSFSSYLFYNVLYWHFPPQAWLPCRPFWSLVWETSGRLLLTNKSLLARKDWISSTKYKNVHPNRYILTYVRDFRLTFPGKKGVSWPGKIEYIQLSDNFVIFSKKIETQMPITFLGYPSKNEKGKKIMISFGALWNS